MGGEWFDEVFDGDFRLGVCATEVLFRERSDYQEILVLETPQWGRVLMLDGMFMTSERDEFIYHEMITHPALCSAKEVENVLVIGGGDGGTIREVLRHPDVKSCTLVEIDGAVVESSRTYLPSIGTAWNDPRLEVKIGDGIEYVRQAQPSTFDVILSDSTDPVGPAEGLFNAAFYESCRSALKPEGILGLQSESPFIMRKTFDAIQKTLGGVFPHVNPYFATVPLYGAALWSWTLATNNPLGEPNTERCQRIQSGCRYYTPGIHRAAFAKPAYLEQARSL